MALAILSQTTFPFTRPYYEVHPVEPPPTYGSNNEFRVESFCQSQISPTPTLLQICNEILQSTHRDLILISHATDQGLNINVDQSPLGLSIVQELINQLCGQSPNPNMSVNITPVLLEKIRAVRALNLNRIAIRACNIGQNPNLLSLIAALFNCDSINAPRLRNIFGWFIPVLYSSTGYVSWQSQGPYQENSYNGKRVGFRLTLSANHSVSGTLAIETENNSEARVLLKHWLNAHFWFSNFSFNGLNQRIPFEALYEDERTYHFPKDSNYLQNIVNESPPRYPIPHNICNPPQVNLDDL